ncbi:hypothetical protein CHGG_06104 [Chaetomium globosum CBS 148.51]|uniref:Uncharacterized protein n=1 Tax=Chaetomium globosum (strain ATCC 6205 / CBS 148.51 / DSM 1962 / NBRC 6347 / NRRL 1970) TaxID=306901 RepID=Q2H5G1_CHAGB|nr:uncharacterized protein CHGG_06104 [Chaetomium globosum CBS 148.51]EAQ89485.1 hypothetical protein CHGG_06104 [Chaetomium globosum CBS 148.51]
MASSRTLISSPPDSPVAGQKPRQKDGPISWHKVACHLPGRNNKDCRKRWHYSIANTIRKGTWMREEDERLREAVELYGTRWSKIAEAVGTRNGDQCWKRWYDCLDPRIDKSPWTPEEDALLLHLVSQTGRNWSDIVHQHFPARTSLAAKNRYSILRRKQDGLPTSTSTSRGSSSVRHAKARTPGGVSRSPAPAPATPSLSSSPYLGVVATPSTTALSTPEPEVLGGGGGGGGVQGGDWMALAAAEIDEMLYRGAQGMGIGGGELDLDMELELDLDRGFGGLSTGWVQQQQPQGYQYQGLDSCQQAGGFDASLVDPRMQQEGYGNGEYYAAQGQQQLGVGGYGYDGSNMLGVYQGGVQIQVTQPGMYDGSSGLVGQSQMGSWQGGYAAGGW